MEWQTMSTKPRICIKRQTMSKKNENLYETANNVYKTENLKKMACFDNKKE
jgi:hypothetical protein